MELFKASVVYDRTMDNGFSKQVTEHRLMEASSYTECELRFVEEVVPFIEGDYLLSDIKRYKVNEIFIHEDEGYYFEAKVAFISLDEKSGTEKQKVVRMLVQSPNIDLALQTLTAGMKGTMSDYETLSLTKMNLEELLPYEDTVLTKIAL